jgi:hypothetical protein
MSENCPRLGLPHHYWPQGNCQYCGELAPSIATKDAEIERLREALKPFSTFAGIVFARNFENTDPVDTMTDADGSKVTLFASDYFAARAALKGDAA